MAARGAMPLTEKGGVLAIRAGVALAAVVAGAAWGVGLLLPLLGAAVAAIVLGVLVRALFQPGPRFEPGIRVTGKKVLQWSIVLLGFGLDLGEVARTGLRSLTVTLATLAVAFLAAWALGRLLRVPGKLTVLVGVGTAICGGSAIAAVAPIIRPQDHETAFAISTIFLFNLVAVLLFPSLGHWMGLSDAGFGLWAGTAINDTSSVVAAGYAYSQSAGDYATIVKLTRATLIVPVCLVLAAFVAWRGDGDGAPRPHLAKVFPWFILWFLVASALRTAGLVPPAMLAWLHLGAVAAMVLALAAIGLSADLRRMRAAGARPVLLGLGVWAAVACASLALQLAAGQA
jgi:uncharacterized integral membrane protein (TIGR00698 family)